MKRTNKMKETAMAILALLAFVITFSACSSDEYDGGIMTFATRKKHKCPENDINDQYHCLPFEVSKTVSKTYSSVTVKYKWAGGIYHPDPECHIEVDTTATTIRKMPDEIRRRTYFNGIWAIGLPSLDPTKADFTGHVTATTVIEYVCPHCGRDTTAVEDFMVDTTFECSVYKTNLGRK